MMEYLKHLLKREIDFHEAELKKQSGGPTDRESGFLDGLRHCLHYIVPEYEKIQAGQIGMNQGDQTDLTNRG